MSDGEGRQPERPSLKILLDLGLRSKRALLGDLFELSLQRVTSPKCRPLADLLGYLRRALRIALTKVHSNERPTLRYRRLVSTLQ